MLTVETTVGDYAVHYLTGPLTKPKTLVCLHGFMGTAKTFQFLEKQTDFNVLAIDLIGHGKSEKSLVPAFYSLESMAQALEEIFDTLHLESLYLLGYSFGGRVGLTYAEKYPHRLAHLFLESASFGLDSEEEKIIRRVADEKLSQKLLKQGMSSFVDHWQELPLFASQKYLNSTQVQQDICNKKEQDPLTMSLALQQGTVANQQNFLKTDLFEIVPMTYIAGNLDQKYTAIGKKINVQKAVPLIIIKDVGHCVHLESPDFFREILYAVIEDKIVEIKEVYSFEYLLDLVTPFKTSYGELQQKKTDIFVVESKTGIQGYGELLSFEAPDYIEETLESDRLIIKNYLLPLLTNKQLYSPRQVRDLFQPVKGNNMAKSAIETAIWDVFAKEKKVSLTDYLGLTSQDIQVGVSIGLQKNEEELLKQVQNYVEQGYSRVKLKIEKGKDVSYVEKIRDFYPDLIIMVDANSAYHLSDAIHLKKLDEYHLAMIEQPLGASDFYEHALLQKEIDTPICLDENIRCLTDVKLAHTIGSAQSINLKVPRVGGLTESLAILEYANEQHLNIWLGGMLESGVGRSLNLILANHPAFTFPGDLSASNRYYKKDVIKEEFNLINGTMRSLDRDGIGVKITNIANKVHYGPK